MSIIATELSGNYFLDVPSLISSLIARELVGHDYLYINQKENRLKRIVSITRELAESLRKRKILSTKLLCKGRRPPVIPVEVIDPGYIM